MPSFAVPSSFAIPSSNEKGPASNSVLLRSQSMPDSAHMHKRSHRKSQSLGQTRKHHPLRNATLGLDLITPARATTAASTQFSHYYHPPPLITTNLQRLNASASSSSSSSAQSTTTASPSTPFSPSSPFSSSSLLDVVFFGLSRGSPTTEDPPKASWDSLKSSSLTSFARRPSVTRVMSSPSRRASEASYSGTGFFVGLLGVGKGIAEEEEEIVYSVDMNDYEITGTIGYGATATVYQATYRDNHRVAIKTIDLDRFARHQVDQLRKEIQIMSLCRHENVLPIYRSFVHHSKLHIVTKLMSAGSILDVLRAGRSTGLDEPSIAIILKQCLQGLDYLHRNQLVHRDIKSANLLIDRTTGHVTLADFGVSGRLCQSNDTPRKRTSFVGTPCWMAPEVIEQRQYDCRADIWSVGITALELAYGRAPSWRLSPVDVLIRTLHDDPPTLEPQLCNHTYSVAFKDLIDSCLNKDPSCRPTTTQLLSHSFFRRTRSRSHLVVNLGLDRLPTLDERAREIAKTDHAAATIFETWDFSLSQLPPPPPLPPPVSTVPTSRPNRVRIVTTNLPRHVAEASTSSTSSSSQSPVSPLLSTPSTPESPPPASAPIMIPSGGRYSRREEAYGCSLEARDEVNCKVGFV